VYKLRRKVLGPEHPDTLASLKLAEVFGKKDVKSLKDKVCACYKTTISSIVVEVMTHEDLSC